MPALLHFIIVNFVCIWHIKLSYGVYILVPLGRNPPDVQGLEVKNWANSTNTVLTWNNNSINASHVDVEISLFDYQGYRLHEGELVTYKNITNSGNYYLDFSKDKVISFG